MQYMNKKLATIYQQSLFKESIPTPRVVEVGTVRGARFHSKQSLKVYVLRIPEGTPPHIRKIAEENLAKLAKSKA